MINTQIAIWTSLIGIVIYVSYLDGNVPIFLSLLATRLWQKIYNGVRSKLLHPKSQWSGIVVWVNSEINARKLAKDLKLNKNKDWKK